MRPSAIPVEQVRLSRAQHVRRHAGPFLGQLAGRVDAFVIRRLVPLDPRDTSRPRWRARERAAPEVRRRPRRRTPHPCARGSPGFSPAREAIFTRARVRRATRAEPCRCRPRSRSRPAHPAPALRRDDATAAHDLERRDVVARRINRRASAWTVPGRASLSSLPIPAPSTVRSIAGPLLTNVRPARIASSQPR